MRRALVWLLVLLTAAPAYAQRVQVQIYGHNSGTLTPVAVNSDGTISVGSALGGSGGDISLSLDNIESDIDNLVTNQGVDMTHGNAVAATGPGILGEAKDIDGAALPNVVTEGQAIRFAATLSGALLTTLVHEDGLSSPIGNEDVASAAAEAGLKVFAIRDDTLDARSATEGDFEYFHTNANGALWTIDVNSAAALTALQLIDNPVFADEAAFTYTSSSVNVAGAVAESTTDALADGVAGALIMDLGRKLYTRFLDPCSGVAKTYYVVDTATAGTLEIANAVASEFFYICSIDLHTNAANNVVIAEDDTDTCSSISAGVTGGTTAGEGYVFAANGGRTLGNGLGAVAKTTTANRYLCLLTSASTQTSGVISYVSAP